MLFVKKYFLNCMSITKAAKKQLREYITLELNTGNINANNVSNTHFNNVFIYSFISANLKYFRHLKTHILYLEDKVFKVNLKYR